MKKLEADIIVISAGTAGLAAALTAAENGAKVLVFEKLGHSGGTANMANGLFAVESKLQRLKQITITREQAYKIHMDFTHWRVNGRLVKAYIDKSADTIDWLEKMGVEFWDIGSHGWGNNHTWHITKGSSVSSGPGTMKTMMKILTERSKALGVQFFFKTPVIKILKENERIIGIEAKDNSNEIIRADAKAVIIATGGYGGHTVNPLGLVGDGIRMAKELGAAVVEKDRPLSKRPRGHQVQPGSPVYACFEQPNLIVNLSGERFINEEQIECIFFRNAISRQKNGIAFSIFDEDTRDYYENHGFDRCRFSIPSFSAPTSAKGFYADLKEIMRHDSNSLFVADSIEELAEKTGIKSDALRENIEEYNQACLTGRDEALGKDNRYLRPVTRPKFYALKIKTDLSSDGPDAFSVTQDGWEGIKINHKTEVLNEEHEVIPGLYAVGIDAACNVYSDTYPNVLPGNNCGFAVNSGRIAGEYASKFVRGI